VYPLRLAPAALAVALAASPAGAIPLIRGLGGPAGFGPNVLPPNDDQFTDAIPIGTEFPEGLWFFGSVYRSLYLNNNGNITFSRQLGEYTPSPFPVASQPMIAPFWADVDTRGLPPPAQNNVNWFTSPGRFIATWHLVGYFGSHDDLQNSFQLILTDQRARNPGDFDVEFRYERCEWTTGDASGGTGGFGGTPAQAGFDAGNLRDFFALPGSFTRGILNVCTTSNVGVAGLWQFQIRRGTVAMCGNRVVERGEDCDDGNMTSGDGCTADCRSEVDGGFDAGFDAGEVVLDAGRDGGPDGGWFRDLGPEDTGVDVPRKPPVDVPVPPVDVPGPPVDAGFPADAALADDACEGWRCGRENRLDGRAGPLGGCGCAVPPSRDDAPFGRCAALGAVAVVGILRRRKRARGI
jgi:MYXO-CTERM domain-containing protein